jgi:hypothetical protein
LTQSQTETVKYVSLFKLAFGITYWMAGQGFMTYAALRDHVQHQAGAMWICILLLGLATAMLWRRLDKWRTE